MPIARQCVSMGLSALLLAAGTLPGCTAQYSMAPAPTMFDAKKPPREARVTLVSGKRIFLLSPSVSGDSLIGIESARGADHRVTGYVAVPLAEIAEVAVERIEPLRTTLAIAGIGSLIWLVYTAATYDPFEGATWTSSRVGTDARGRP